MDYTVTAMLASIRRRGSIPNAASTGTQDADLLREANEELRGHLTETLLKAREEYFVATYSTPIVSGQASYLIPTRAIGAKLRACDIIDLTGNPRSLVRIDIQELENWAPNTSSTPIGLYYQGNSLVLVPVPNQTFQTLRMTYFKEPNELVPTANVGIITSIQATTPDSTHTTINYSNTPAGFSTGVAFDFVQANPHFDGLAIDKVATGSGASSLIFLSTDVPSTLAVGDYMCLARQSPVPMIPAALHPVLYQRVLCTALRAAGDLELLQAAQAELEDMEERALELLDPRLDGSPKLITNPYGPLTPLGSYRGPWWP